MRCLNGRKSIVALLLAALAGIAGLTGGACAQPRTDLLQRAARLAPDLVLPNEASNPDTPQMALLKPDGPGPFPALVLLHQCGGLRPVNAVRLNWSMLGWAKEAVSRGYVALLLDSLGPRAVDSVCFGAKNGVNLQRGVRDALQGLAHLQKLPYVDAKNVYFAGFSWGAMIGLLSSSASWSEALGEGRHFRSVAVLYPGCFDIHPANGPSFPLVNRDIDTPVLALLGELDTETPASDCLSRFEPLKAAGRPIEWHLYAGTTHCWDCETLDGLRKTDLRGASVEYRYSRENTRDAVERVFGFFSRIQGASSP